MKPILLAVAILALIGLHPSADGTKFTEWLPPVNLGSVVNSPNVDQCVSVSKNGLSLFFSSRRLDAAQPRELFVTTRASVTAPWTTPQLLPNVNSADDESCPSLSLDEHRLYFVSARPGGCGGTDIYVSRRHDRRDDLGWQEPENLGCDFEGFVNTPDYEQTPNFYEDESGAEVMYFTSGYWYYRIFKSVMRHDDSFGPGTLVPELNDPDGYQYLGPAVRRDGLEIIFASTRPPRLGGYDLWTATRESTEDAWSTPVNLTVLNTTFNEIGKMAFSFDGTQFYFASNRTGPGTFGNTDIYVTTREKVRGK